MSEPPLLSAVTSPPPPPSDGSAMEEEVSSAAVKDQPVFSLEILSLIKTSQLQNGLRHGDYQRYRQYCTRRISRLRVVLKHTAGPKSAVKPRPLPSHLSSPLFLTLLLTQAERSWSYAMQLAGERSEETPRRRFHQLKRLKRARDFSQALNTACQHFADTRTQLQAEAYAADIAGSYAFEKGDFDAALQSFLHAKAVYQQLGKVGGSDIAALCEERVAHQEDQIRMSRYFKRQQSQAEETVGGGGGGGEEEEEMGEEDLLSSSTSLSTKLQLLMKEREEKAAAQLDTVTWQGKTVPVSNEKARVILVRLQRMKDEAKRRKGKGKGEAEEEDGEEGSRSLTGLYQQMANAYDDIGKIAKDDLIDVKLESHRQNLLSLQQFVAFERLRCLSHRHSLLASALGSSYSTPAPSPAPSSSASAAKSPPSKKSKRGGVKVDEVVLLYEKLIANLSDMRLILKQQAAQGADSALISLVSLQFSSAEAHRVFFIAESYSQAGHFAEAYALFQRVVEKIQQATAAGANGEEEERIQTMTELRTLENKARCHQLQVHAKAVLHGMTGERETQRALASLSLEEGAKSGEGAAPSSSFTSTTGPLLSRLDNFDVGPAAFSQLNLTDWPPAYAAVPTKPVLFDLAFNAVSYPDMVSQKRTEQLASKQNAAAGESKENVEEEEEEDGKGKAEPAKVGGGLLGAVGGAVGKWWSRK